MQGAFSFACLKRSLTLMHQLQQTFLQNQNQTRRRRNFSFSTNPAISVLPVPGGPTNNAPFGILAPNAVYFLGFLRKSTISLTSSLLLAVQQRCQK